MDRRHEVLAEIHDMLIRGVPADRAWTALCAQATPVAELVAIRDRMKAQAEQAGRGDLIRELGTRLQTFYARALSSFDAAMAPVMSAADDGREPSDRSREAAFLTRRHIADQRARLDAAGTPSRAALERTRDIMMARLAAARRAAAEPSPPVSDESSDSDSDDGDGLPVLESYEPDSTAVERAMRLMTLKTFGPDETPGIDVCFVCLDDTKRSFLTMACDHNICTDCAASWFHKSATCPMCRKQII